MRMWSSPKHYNTSHISIPLDKSMNPHPLKFCPYNIIILIIIIILERFPHIKKKKKTIFNLIFKKSEYMCPQASL